MLVLMLISIKKQKPPLLPSFKGHVLTAMILTLQAWTEPPPTPRRARPQSEATGAGTTPHPRLSSAPTCSPSPGQRPGRPRRGPAPERRSEPAASNRA